MVSIPVQLQQRLLGEVNLFFRSTVVLTDDMRDLLSAMARHLASAMESLRATGSEFTIAVGDGALGFWNALDKAFGSTKHQRCWVHKVKNVLNCFPKQMAATVKSDLDDIQHAALRAEAKAAMDLFSEKYKLKYEKGVKAVEA